MQKIKLIGVEDCTNRPLTKPGEIKIMCPNCSFVFQQLDILSERKDNGKLLDECNDALDEVKIKIEKIIKKNL